MTQLVNLTNLTTNSTLKPITTKRIYEPTFTLGMDGGTSQSSITFYDPTTGAGSFRVRAVSTYLKGKKSNKMLFGVALASGRYYITCWLSDKSQLGSTINTTGGHGGYTSGESGALVSKLNSSVLNEFIRADLLNNFDDIDYTGASTANFGDALRMHGGRGWSG